MSPKGSRTEANLIAAFASESQANRRYLYFAQKAEAEGHAQTRDECRESRRQRGREGPREVPRPVGWGRLGQHGEGHDGPRGAREHRGLAWQA